MTDYKTPILYSVASTGTKRFWQGFAKDGSHWSEYGAVGGKTTVTAKSEAVRKNVGRANETDEVEQAVLEIQAIEKKKRKKGYNENPDKAGETNHVKPMLAKKFVDLKDTIIFGKFEDGKISKVYNQPKLDGIRCVARADGMWSRTGEKIISCPHIEDYLKPVFLHNPELILDGELYNHEMKNEFSKIQSIVRREKLREGDLEKAREYIQFHIYDTVDFNKGFFDRIYPILKLLENIRTVNTDPYVQFVRTRSVTSFEDLDKQYEEYLIDGYEGQMIRTHRYPYQPKRSVALLKRKERMDGEFKVLEIHEGKGKAAGKAFNVVLENPSPKDPDPKYKTFGAGVVGTHEFCAEVFENRDKYIGKMATVKYFRETEYGTPFHGKVYHFHLEDRW